MKIFHGLQTDDKGKTVKNVSIFQKEVLAREDLATGLRCSRILHCFAQTLFWFYSTQLKTTLVQVKLQIKIVYNLSGHLNPLGMLNKSSHHSCTREPLISATILFHLNQSQPPTWIFSLFQAHNFLLMFLWALRNQNAIFTLNTL